MPRNPIGAKALDEESGVSDFETSIALARQKLYLGIAFASPVFQIVSLLIMRRGTKFSCPDAKAWKYKLRSLRRVLNVPNTELLPSFDFCGGDKANPKRPSIKSKDSLAMLKVP